MSIANETAQPKIQNDVETTALEPLPVNPSKILGMIGAAVPDVYPDDDRVTSQWYATAVVAVLAAAASVSAGRYNPAKDEISGSSSFDDVAQIIRATAWLLLVPEANPQARTWQVRLDLGGGLGAEVRRTVELPLRVMDGFPTTARGRASLANVRLA